VGLGMQEHKQIWKYCKKTEVQSKVREYNF